MPNTTTATKDLQKLLRAYKRKDISKERYEAERKKILNYLAQKGIKL